MQFLNNGLFGPGDLLWTPQVRRGISLTITPTAGWVQSATYESFAGTATHLGSATITSVEWKLESGGAYAAVDAFADGAWSVTTMALAEGVNTLYVKATDSDAETKEMTLAISVDTVDPVVNVGSDINHDGTGDTFTLDSSMFTEANPAMVEYKLDSGGYTTWASPYADVDITIPTDESNHTIDLRVTDLSGRVVSDQVGVNYSSGVSYLLDTYTTAAVAYSLRLLKSDYAGSCIKVRRASDNAEQDIGFSSGVLDTSSLETFCSGTDGFATTWYDQSGSARDFTQSTAGSQPKIVSSGTVIAENTKSALLFNGTSDTMTGPSGDQNMLMNSNYANYSSVVCTQVGTNANNILFAHSVSKFAIYSTYANKIYYDTGDTTGRRTSGDQPAGWDDNQHLVSYMSNGSTATVNVDSIELYVDATLTGSPTYTGGTTLSPSAAYFKGYIQELVIWADDKGADNSGIETNVNDHYGVYL